MNYVRLGDSGLKVSRLCLGGMTYGDPAWRPWVLRMKRAPLSARRWKRASISSIPPTFTPAEKVNAFSAAR